MAYLQTDVTKVTTRVLQNMKLHGEKIAMLTAYDYSMASLLESTKIDVVLVGDSAANVMEGHKTTLPITLDEMIVYATSVVRAIKRALVVVDMPFGTYAVRATEQEEADQVKRDALTLQEAGCFAIVLEKIPAKLAGEVTAELKIPTIGIGAGADTDGQVLVLQDMLGITRQFKPRYLRTYGTFGEDIANAIRHYISDVKGGDFPNEKEQY